jgi:multidrug efflux system membrane fusion protein
MNDLMLNKHMSTPSHWNCFCKISTIFIFLMIFPISGCTEKKQGNRPVFDIPVKTAIASKKDVPIEISAIGTIKAYSVVNITSHVDGELIQIHVKEGQMVEKGQVLFNIDDRSYQTALESARSNLSKDRIKLEKAKKDAQRYADLLKKDYVTKDQAEQAQTDFEVLEATIKGDEAVLQTAELNLSYCRITSPITGRAGSILVNQGNLIKANDSTRPLMVINQIQPVYMQFSVPEQRLPEIQSQIRTNELKVLINVTEKPDETKEGRLTFVDNSIDTNTGTIDLKATFDNSDNRLWPGQFVNVVLVLGVKTSAVVVPSAAVQMGQQGYYVFIVKKDNTVESRDVTPGSQKDDLTVIEKGVSVGDTVVTDGQLRLSPGAKVEVKNATQTRSERQQ